MQDGGARPTQRSWTVYLQTEWSDGKILKHKRTKKWIKTPGFSEEKEGEEQEDDEEVEEEEEVDEQSERERKNDFQICQSLKCFLLSENEEQTLQQFNKHICCF